VYCKIMHCLWLPHLRKPCARAAAALQRDGVAAVKPTGSNREAHFRALLEAAPDGVVIADSDGRIVLVNAQTERLFGYERDSLIGRPLTLLMPERFHEAHEDGLRRVAAGGEQRVIGKAVELVGRRKDGAEFPLELSLASVTVDRQRQFTGILRDVTERKADEQRFLDREARFRSVLDAAPDAIVIVDVDGRIVLVNAQTERLFGYARDRLVGQPVEILVPESLQGRHVGHRRDFLAAPRVRSMGEGLDLSGRRADGTEFPIAISLSPVETTEGALTIAAIRDVTYAKQAEKALRDRETRLRALLEAAPDAVVIANKQGRIELVNAQTERLFGYPRDRLIGQPIEILVPERFQSRHVGHREGYLAEPRVRSMGEGLELYGRRADGSEFPVAISLSPVETAEGALVIAAVRDVTERHRIEREIQDLNERLTRDNTELAAVNRELEAFSYSVSHDLRAPLRAIDGFSQALLEDCGGDLGDIGRGYLSRVRRAAQRMGVLIDDLIKLSRVTRADMHLQGVDLSAMAQRIAQDLKADEPDRMADFEIQGGLAANGDARLLQIVLENFMGNAWKFTAGRAPTRIEFGCCRHDDQTAYFIRDNGAGFDMAHADQLFRAFQRLHDAEQFPGTGIGLATVQRIVHKHGGRVWAAAEVGKGATFYFTL
jgi:PAS domain S-box-containing protein